MQHIYLFIIITIIIMIISFIFFRHISTRVIAYIKPLAYVYIYGLIPFCFSNRGAFMFVFNYHKCSNSYLSFSSKGALVWCVCVCVYFPPKAYTVSSVSDSLLVSSDVTVPEEFPSLRSTAVRKALTLEKCLLSYAPRPRGVTHQNL